MNTKLIRNLLFGLLVAGYLYYGLRYIQESSFVIGDKTYYVLFDDAMISMRYAYNLAHGHGLVWNIGERVEGFTNPLWVGYMALFHLFPIPANTISLSIQLSGLVFMTATLFFVRWITEEFTDDLLTMLAAVAFTAFYIPLNWWALLGMEGSILTLMLCAAVYILLRTAPSRFSPWTYVLLAVMTLIRIDMAVPYLVILGVMFFVQPQFRKQHLLWGLGLLILSMGGQTLARYLYYGSWLPNTYYLKVEGFPLALRILRGLYVLVHLAYYSNWVLFLLPLALFLFRRDWKVVLLTLLFAGQIAYSTYVGGDAWEHKGGANRYISIAMPFYFIGLIWVLDEIRRKAVAGLRSTHAAGYASHVIFAAVFVMSFLNMNALAGEWKSIERLALSRKSIFIAGNDQNLGAAVALEATTKPDASIAVIGAGTIPYFLPDHYAIDLLGKTDPVIARGPVKTPMSIDDLRYLQPGYTNYMRPGHMKWNYAHSIGQLKPDVIVAIWEGTSGEAKPYLDQDYVYAVIGEKIKVYLRKNSPNIYWDKVIIKE